MTSLRPLVADVRGLWRFARGLRPFLAAPYTTESAMAFVRQRIATRDRALLAMLEHGVFAHPRSPYLRLFRSAGCELGDVRRLVAVEGVEGALAVLRDAGVYVTFEELKGRTPAVRGSQTFRFDERDFDNPMTGALPSSSSGGTRGRPTRVGIDLEHIAESAAPWAVWFAEHGWLSRPLVYWTPTHSGIVNGQLRCAKLGKPLSRWFAIVGMGPTRMGAIAAIVHRTVRHATGMPRPELVPLDDAARVGEYLVELLRRGESPCINTYASAAMRIATAMGERGASLRGVAFLLRGEPLTEARRATIEASGASVAQTYGFAEGGPVAAQCATPASADDVHVFLDGFAVIQRDVALGDETVRALLLTSLRRAAPRILLNAEIGDHAVVEHARCACLFGEVGYATRLRTVRSFDKLTAEGMTILAADVAHVLESVLPARFGGVPTDYQLVEESEAGGLVRYCLRVDPALSPIDPEAIAGCFLAELGRIRPAYGFMVSLWARTGTMRVVPARPLQTARGKVLPFRRAGV